MTIHDLEGAPELAAVRTADPAAHLQPGDPGLRAALDALLTSVTTADAEPDGWARPRPAARLRRRGLVAGAAAVTLALGGGVAAAAFHSAHTGDRATDPRITDHSEWLDTSGDDFPAIARQLAGDIPFAPGDGPDTYIGVALPTTGEVSTEGVHTFLSVDALCGWEGYWLQERGAGDEAAAGRAAQAIQSLVADSGMAYTADDPADTIASYQALGTAAVSGDEAPIRSDWSVNCASLPRPWANR